MPTKITALTDAQKAAIPAHVEHWIKVGQCTDEADWATFERAAEQCYRHAGLPWHGRVVRVRNPLVLALAAPIAAHLLSSRDAVDVAVGGPVGGAVRGPVGGAVSGAVDVAVGGAVDVAVGDAVRDAERVAVRGAVRDAVGGAVRGPVGGAVSGAVHLAVRGAVDGAVGGPVDDAVDVAVGGPVDDAVRDAVRDAERVAVRGAVRDAERVAVRGAVRGGWWRYLGGQWWVNWQAWTSYFRDVCDLDLPGDLWDRDRAYADAQSSAGWWWPHRQFVMVCDRPATLHLEQVRPTGWGSHRLHCEDGPAISWRDGWALHYWHGIRVPADLVEGDGWAPDRILREPNAEVRRCAIEKRGWDRFVHDAGLAQVGDAEPDPGNPGRELRLYDVPTAIYDEPVRVLICENASRDRDGSLRTFGLTVPADMPDPTSAAAWTFGCGRAEYAELARAT